MEEAMAKTIAAKILRKAVQSKINLTLDEAEKIFLLSHKELLLGRFQKGPKTTIGNSLIRELEKEIERIEYEMKFWPHDQKKINNLKDEYKIMYLSRKDMFKRVSQQMDS